jgi:hypothetical protein
MYKISKITEQFNAQQKTNLPRGGQARAKARKGNPPHTTHMKIGVQVKITSRPPVYTPVVLVLVLSPMGPHALALKSFKARVKKINQEGNTAACLQAPRELCY